MLIKKLWRVKNTIEWLFKHYILPGGSGLLSHKDNPKDRKFEIGISKTINREVWEGYQFRQQPNNTCVFASRALGISHQDGVRWSIRWDVKVARKKGWLSGNGWSYLRAENKIAERVGRIPYILMPDETEGLSWNEYSKWTKEDEELLKVAKKYKRKAMKVESEKEMEEALAKGHVLFTALNWYSAMNKPQPEKYLLRWVGRKVGGHAIFLNKNEGNHLYKNPQTFGEKYGLDGVAWFPNPWKNRSSAIYVEEHLSNKKLVNLVKKYYNSKVVRDFINPKCYLIQNGNKKHIKTMESYWHYVNIYGKHHTIATEILQNIPNA